MTLSSDIITITGNLGNDPTMGTTKAGKPVLNFRVGSSSGRWDRSTGAWVDDGTSWYAISAFGALAQNARASLHCGDPVVITGRLRIKEWENDGRKGSSADIIADAIGHDLNRGTSGFARRIRSDGAVSQPAAESGSTDAEGADFEQELSEEDRRGWEAHGLLPTDAATDTDAERDIEGESVYA